MKKKLILICIICMGLFLCGCEGEMNSVNKEESPLADSSDTGEFGVKYCAVSELKRTKISDISFKADNLKLPSEVDFSSIGEVAVLDMETEQTDVKKKKKYCEKLFGIAHKELWKKKNNLLVYDNKKEKKYCAIGEAGFLCYSNDEKSEYTMKESYNLKKDDVSAVKIELRDGEQPLSLMCIRATKWLADNMEIKGFNYKITRACVNEKTGEDSTNFPKLLELSAEYEYKGIPVCNFSTSYNNNQMEIPKKTDDNHDDGQPKPELAVFPFGVQLQCTATDELTYFSNLGGRLKLKEAEKVDQVVDLESAIKIVHEKLSGMTYSFDDIVPLYILSPWECSSGQNGFEPGVRVTGTPVYAFIIKDAKGSSMKPNCGEYYCFVDMISGNFGTNFDGSF